MGMKCKVSLWGIITTTILGFSILFSGCNKDEVNAEVKYYGKVVRVNSGLPFPNLEVKVTDGNNTHCQTFTDTEGKFSLLVKVNEINGNYYVLVGDISCVQKRIEFPGFGQAEIDLGTIEIEGPALPVVKTKPISNVSDNKATSGGEVVSDGRSPVTARGVCWSKSEYPTTENGHSTNGSGLGEFTSQLVELEAGATYYVRAYATNSVGTGYGEQLTLSTSTGLPRVITDSVFEITSTTAKCAGNVEANFGYAITARGVCWSDATATPTPNNGHTEEVAATGKFTSLMIGLEHSHTYYVRAYAVSEKGIGYGETIKFTTTDGKPVVETGAVSNITATTATISATVISQGDSPLTACGVCWSNATSSPSLSDDHTDEVARVGEFTSKMINLTGMSTYYVRAYASNQNGTVYGNTVSFFTAATADGLPIVSTLDPGENITSTSISTGGNVTNDGGFPVTECGVVYSTLPYPTLNNAEKVVGGSGVGYYSATITGVSPSEKTYYIRAYATNVNGTSYGDQVIVTPEKSEYLSLKTMSYGGYTYRIKFMGELSWYDGNNACQNMVVGGYSDWFMPDKAEVQAIIAAYGLWNKTVTTTDNSSLRMNGCTNIWTGQDSGNYAYYYYIKDTGGSSYKWMWALGSDTSSKSNVKGVFAVRKY